MANPSTGSSGRVMPMAPPTTQNAWRMVSDHENTRARTWSSTSRWMSASRLSFASWPNSPVASPSSTKVGSE